MPVHVNKIGEFQFLQMAGPPYLRQEQVELIERPGVDGSGLRRLGQRGKPFQVVTTNYVESLAEAKAQMDLYKAEVADDTPLELIRHSVSEGTFFVLAVVEQYKGAIFNSLGGFDGNEECLHVVTWTLLG